ncbi:MAG TPA: hypothetical protein VFY26_08155 [Anaerolineales bacterium]|nr:hypothetical protein [Anaerolineales bacterium]
MSHEPGPERAPDQPGVYRIRVRGHLSPQWTDWFAGLTITPEDDGSTLLSGSVIDQAALHGILKKVRDLGMPLLSVNFIGPDTNSFTEVADE